MRKPRFTGLEFFLLLILFAPILCILSIVLTVFDPLTPYEKEVLTSEYGDEFTHLWRSSFDFHGGWNEHFIRYKKEKFFVADSDGRNQNISISGISNNETGTIYQVSLIADGEEWGHIYLIRRPGSDTFEKLKPDDPLYPSPTPKPSPTPLPTPVNLWPQYGGVPPSFAPKPP